MDPTKGQGPSQSPSEESIGSELFWGWHGTTGWAAVGGQSQNSGRAPGAVACNMRSSKARAVQGKATHPAAENVSTMEGVIR
jgi:hypothetical protein